MDMDMPLYRYYSLPAFLHLFGSKRLRFSRYVDWPDKYEGTSYKFSTRIFNDDSAVDINHIFGSCWTLEVDIRECHTSDESYQHACEEIRQHGSGLLWETYCPNSGLRVKTTLGKILNAINIFTANNPNLKLCHRKIEYSSNLYIQKNTVESLFHKRIPFRHDVQR